MIAPRSSGCTDLYFLLLVITLDQFHEGFCANEFVTSVDFFVVDTGQIDFSVQVKIRWFYVDPDLRFSGFVPMA